MALSVVWPGCLRCESGPEPPVLPAVLPCMHKGSSSVLYSCHPACDKEQGRPVFSAQLVVPLYYTNGNLVSAHGTGHNITAGRMRYQGFTKGVTAYVWLRAHLWT